MKLYIKSFCLIAALAIFSFVNIGASYAQSTVGDLGIRGPIENEKKDAKVSPTGSKRYYQKCKNHLPFGFTPSTRDDFCTCASINITKVLTNGEVEAVEGPIKRQDRYYENALIKYVEGVVIPCIETPIRDLSYVSCLEERAHDHRIRNFPAYCSCAGDVAARMVIDRGSNDMINHYISMERNPDFSPVESFMNSPNYRHYIMTSMRTCIQPVFLQWHRY